MTRIGLLLCVFLLPGCALSGPKSISPEPAGLEAESDNIRFHIDKLPDRTHVRPYGDADNPRPWYIAAEALGQIGKPAVPALIERLDTQDPYELKLVLYALMLASQDPALQTATGGDYLRLGTVLTESSNDENLYLARDWWQRHRHLWR